MRRKPAGPRAGPVATWESPPKSRAAVAMSTAGAVGGGSDPAGGATKAHVHFAATHASAITSTAVTSVPKRFGAGAGSAGRAAMGE